MPSVNITRKDALVSNAAGNGSDIPRQELTQVVVSDGLIHACNGFILAWRKIKHEGNMVIHSKFLTSLRVDALFRSSTKKLVKITPDETTVFANSNSNYGKDQLSYTEKMKVLEIKPTEDHRRIALDKKILMRLLSCFPDSEKQRNRSKITAIQLFVPSDPTQPVIMHCNGTHAIIMPLFIHYEKEDW